MAYRRTNDTKTVIFPETSYGVDPVYSSVDIPITINSVTITPVVNPITVSRKTNTNQPTICENIAGTIGGTFSISATYQDEHKYFIGAFLGDSSSPYANSDKDIIGSFQIANIRNDDKNDIAKGCVIESISLTSSTNGTIELTVSGRCKSVAFEQSAISGVGYNDVTVPACKSMKFSDGSYSIYGYSTLNSFTLSLTNTFADDTVLYQNSDTKLREILLGFTGTLSTEFLYDSSNVIASSELYSDTPEDASIAVTDGTATHTYALRIRATSTDLPDSEKAMVLHTVESELVYDGTNDCFVMTVS